MLHTEHEKTCRHEWHQIPSLCGIYFACRCGEVSKLARLKSGAEKFFIKKQTKTSHGYMKVSITINNTSRNAYVHSLVAEAFLGPRPPCLQVRHLDGDGKNNVVKNLEYGTQSQNEADKLKHGRSNSGSRHGMAKLNESDAYEIATLRASGKPLKEIAEMYMVSTTTVCRISKRRGWKSATGGASCL